MITYSSFNFGSDPGSTPATFGASTISRLTVALPLGDGVGGAIFPDHLRVVYRDVLGAPLEIAHRIAASLHDLGDQPVGGRHGRQRIVDELGLGLPPALSEGLALVR